MRRSGAGQHGARALDFFLRSNIIKKKFIFRNPFLPRVYFCVSVFAEALPADPITGEAKCDVSHPKYFLLFLCDGSSLPIPPVLADNAASPTNPAIHSFFKAIGLPKANTTRPAAAAPTEAVAAEPEPNTGSERVATHAADPRPGRRQRLRPSRRRPAGPQRHPSGNASRRSDENVLLHDLSTGDVGFVFPIAAHRRGPPQTAQA